MTFGVFWTVFEQVEMYSGRLEPQNSAGIPRLRRNSSRPALGRLPRGPVSRPHPFPRLRASGRPCRTYCTEERSELEGGSWLSLITVIDVRIIFYACVM